MNAISVREPVGRSRGHTPRLSLGRSAAVMAAVAVILMALLTSIAPASDAPVAATAFQQTSAAAVSSMAAPESPAPVPLAMAPAAPLSSPAAEVTVVSLRIVEAQPIPVTVGELYQALARSPWPRELWPQVVRIAQCEARLGTGVDGAAEGDGGRALGVLQIRVDAHRELARDFDLLTIDGALGAAWVVYQRADRSFAPWSCA